MTMAGEERHHEWFCKTKKKKGGKEKQSNPHFSYHLLTIINERMDNKEKMATDTWLRRLCIFPSLVFNCPFSLKCILEIDVEWSEIRKQFHHPEKLNLLSGGRSPSTTPMFKNRKAGLKHWSSVRQRKSCSYFCST